MSYPGEWLSSKEEKVPSAAEDLGQLNLARREEAQQCGCCGKGAGSSECYNRIGCTPPKDQRQRSRYLHQYSQLPHSQQPKGGNKLHSISRWRNKMWNVQTMECSALIFKRNIIQKTCYNMERIRKHDNKVCTTHEDKHLLHGILWNTQGRRERA